MQSRGAALARKVSRDLVKAARAAFMRGSVFDPRVVLLRDLLPELVAAAKVAIALTRPGMSFTVYDDLLDTIGTLDPAEAKLLLAMRERAFVLLDDKAGQIELRLREEINTLLAEGATTSTGVKRLQETFDALGLTPSNGYALENMFRTQTQLAYGAARWQADQDPDIQEILWGYEYATVGDDRVRPSHAALDGVVLPKEDPFWSTGWPPNGYSCRCQVIPLFEEEPIKRPPPGATPDKDFGFNPGQYLNDLATGG